MRYELNFDEDKVNDVLVVGGASYDLKGCCDLVNEQQATITALKEENKQLKEKLNNLKKDETMLYHYYTLARYGGDGV